MRSFFKGLALLVAVTCLVWLGVLWHWQSTRRVMSTADIVAYLGVLPLVSFGLVLLARWAWGGAQRSEERRQQQRQEAAQAAAAQGQPAAAATIDPRSLPLLLWTAALNCAAGQDAAALQSALAAGDPRPAPQAEWRDEQGLPVLCAPIPELELAAAEQLWQAAPTAADLPPPDASVMRALAALAPVLVTCCDSLAARQAVADDGPSTSASGQHGALPPVRLLTDWPAHWPAGVRQHVNQCLRAHVQGLLADQVPGVQVLLTPMDEAPLWQQVDRLVNALAREERPDLLLLVAAQSDLSDARLAQIERGSGLLSGHHAKGQLPGESAAALLLSGRDWLLPTQAAQTEPPVALLHRPAWQLRDKPVDGPGRINAQVAEAAVDQALTLARVAATELRAIVSDADQHTGRATELFGAMISRLPQLDASEDALLTGPLLGRTGPCASLIAVALAGHCAGQDDAPVLALSVDDPIHRIAFIVRPPSALASVMAADPAGGTPPSSAAVSS